MLVRGVVASRRRVVQATRAGGAGATGLVRSRDGGAIAADVQSRKLPVFASQRVGGGGGWYRGCEERVSPRVSRAREAERLRRRRG